MYFTFKLRKQEISLLVHRTFTSFNKNFNLCKIELSKQGGEYMNEHLSKYDFTPIGLEIKKARDTQKITREKLAETLDISVRHLQAVELEGKYPSFKLFINLIKMFNIPVDQYIFPDKPAEKSPVRKQLDTLLNNLTDNELSVILATASALCKMKGIPEE